MATRAIRAPPRASEAPVVALTANAFGEDRDLWLGAGMSGFIARPVDPGTLYAAVFEWIEH